MTSWSEGYVSDIAYSIGYYREMAPDHVGYAALSLGKHPGGAVKPKRVLELGFGMGLGFVLGAAANPQTEFEGCDFNPEHIMHARALAEGAGLTNVTIREASFQELAAEAREGQHDLDIIQLHGILTWVSEDAHRAIVEIARKRLKPGGLLYVSYNCMPGWAPMLPVQRLMREHAKRHSGSSLQRTAGAVQAVKQMIEGKGRFFAANPAIEQRIEKLGTMQASYLAHEYLNENWFIFHVADVAEMFGQAKLTFLGSATIAENIDGVSVPAEMREMVAQAADPIWKETLRDIAGNKQFRRDLYARGVTNLNNHRDAAAAPRHALHAGHAALGDHLQTPEPDGRTRCQARDLRRDRRSPRRRDRALRRDPDPAGAGRGGIGRDAAGAGADGPCRPGPADPGRARDRP